jgi:hypothetical protein
MLDANHTIVSPLFDQQSFRLDGPGNWASLTRNGTLYLNTPNNLNEYDDPQCCNMHVDDGLRDDFLDLASTPFPDGLNLTYDKNGNQTDTVRQSLRYNFANLPVTAFDLSRGTQVAAYSYDGLGRRAKRQVTGGEGTQSTEGFAYAGTLFPDAIEESDAAGGFAGLGAVGPGGGCLWHVHADGSTQYLLEDALGSTVALVPGMSAGGPQVIERVVYDPFGKPTFQSAGNVPLVQPGSGTFVAESQFGNSHLFLGMHYDPELGARGTSAGLDFGGLYAAAGFYNPNEGRPMTARSGGPNGNDADNYIGCPRSCSETSVGHNHGIRSGKVKGGGGLFAVYGSSGGYYSANKIHLSEDPSGPGSNGDGVDYLDYAWGVSQSGTMAYGSGGGEGKANFHDLHFTSPKEEGRPGGNNRTISLVGGALTKPCPPYCPRATFDNWTMKDPGPIQSPADLVEKNPGPPQSPISVWKQPGPIQSPEWLWRNPGPPQSPAWLWKNPGPNQSPEWRQPGPVQSLEWAWKNPGPSQSPAWAWKNPGPPNSPAWLWKNPGPVQ